MASDRAQRFRDLADRCEAEKPSREMDMAVESLLKGMMSRTDLPPRHATSLNGASKVSNWLLLHASDIGADGLPLVVLGDPSVTPAREVKGLAGRTLAATWCAAGLRALADEEERKA